VTAKGVCSRLENSLSCPLYYSGPAAASSGGTVVKVRPSSTSVAPFEFCACFEKSELYEFALDRENSPPSVSPMEDAVLVMVVRFTVRYDISLAARNSGATIQGRD